MKTFTHTRVGEHGRLGNQLWQIMSTAGMAAEAGARVHVRPDWKYREWITLPPEWYEPPEGEVVDTSTLGDGYLQDVAMLPDKAHRFQWLYPTDAGRSKIASTIGQLVTDGWGPFQYSTGVHVRRTDYLDPWRPHGCLPLEWYQRNWPDGQVYVFSDEPTWCEDNLPGKVVHTGVDWLDWYLLSMCGAHVISNSSFAWWAAYRKAGPVVCPDPWFQGETRHMLVEGWTPAAW